MVKGAASGPGIYSATYSGVPVYEFQFGTDLKEHVMRRRKDDWINATHILKAAGFDKPARTRILEREVQKDIHEKIQGGYGKYQGTWIPLENGEALAHRNNVFERLRSIFEFQPGNESPPPAPRHASKPKVAKRPAVPKWGAPPPAAIPESFDNGDVVMNEDDTPDNLTVASASYMGDDDHYDMSHFSTGHRKRRREEEIQDRTEQQHSVYGDELLDYFMLSRNEQPAVRPEPPPNFQPNWIIDNEQHTALHWASAMGDVDVIRQLKRFGATLSVQNVRGETPLMRAVSFTNCYEKQTFPAVMKELFDTIPMRDSMGYTIIHHAAVMPSGRVTSHSCSRWYLDNILTKLQETHDPNFVQQLVDAQSKDGNTALHLSAQQNARKCVRSLLGRGASTNIPNNEGIRAEDLIKELNASKHKADRAPQRSSSPFAPDTQRHPSFRDAISDSVGRQLAVTFSSDAANTVQSRITPLVLEKFQDLAHSYEEEFREKDEAEHEARRILVNTQAELAAVRQQIADLERHIEPEASAAQVHDSVGAAGARVLSLVAHQNRLRARAAVERELAASANGANGANDGGAASNRGEESTAEDEAVRAALARELNALLGQQRLAEQEYVDALGVVGTGDKIDRYRRLLKRCLDPREAENLDANIDSMIELMEEERDVPAPGHGAAVTSAGEPKEIAVPM